MAELMVEVHKIERGEEVAKLVESFSF